jgi:adenine-specific DNA methylase
VGADAFASDLNPVAVLLNKVVLEYIPRYGQRLADEVRKWGQWVQEQAEQELAEFYPQDPDGATPIAYLWARTITCEGPGCGTEVPLMRGLWLSKQKKRPVALRMIPNPEEKRVDFEIIKNAKTQDVGEGTIRRGSATCPVCNCDTSIHRSAKFREGLTKTSIYGGKAPRLSNRHFRASAVRQHQDSQTGCTWSATAPFRSVGQLKTGLVKVRMVPAGPRTPFRSPV